MGWLSNVRGTLVGGVCRGNQNHYQQGRGEQVNFVEGGL